MTTEEAPPLPLQRLRRRVGRLSPLSTAAHYREPRALQKQCRERLCGIAQPPC